MSYSTLCTSCTSRDLKDMCFFHCLFVQYHPTALVLVLNLILAGLRFGLNFPNIHSYRTLLWANA